MPARPSSAAACDPWLPLFCAMQQHATLLTSLCTEGNETQPRLEYSSQILIFPEFSYFLFHYCALLGFEPRALHMPAKCSFSALYPGTSSYFVFWDKDSMLPRLAMNL